MSQWRCARCSGSAIERDSSLVARGFSRASLATRARKPRKPRKAETRIDQEIRRSGGAQEKFGALHHVSETIRKRRNSSCAPDLLLKSCVREAIRGGDACPRGRSLACPAPSFEGKGSRSIFRRSAKSLRVTTETARTQPTPLSEEWTSGARAAESRPKSPLKSRHTEWMWFPSFCELSVLDEERRALDPVVVLLARAVYTRPGKRDLLDAGLAQARRSIGRRFPAPCSRCRRR